MKKAIFVIFILLLSMPALAEMSKNISESPGWAVGYEKMWHNDPAKFHVANISNRMADRVQVLIYCYDSHGNEIAIIDRFPRGILRPGYEFTFTIKLPDNTSTMKAEVFCDWK